MEGIAQSERIAQELAHLPWEREWTVPLGELSGLLFTLGAAGVPGGRSLRAKRGAQRLAEQGDPPLLRREERPQALLRQPPPGQPPLAAGADDGLGPLAAEPSTPGTLRPGRQVPAQPVT